MRLLGRDKLHDLSGFEAHVELWLKVWMTEISYAHWGCADDLLKQYPKANDIGDGIFRFNIGDEDQAVDLLVSFPHKTALITNIY